MPALGSTDLDILRRQLEAVTAAASHPESAFRSTACFDSPGDPLRTVMAEAG